MPRGGPAGRPPAAPGAVPRPRPAPAKAKAAVLPLSKGSPAAAQRAAASEASELARARQFDELLAQQRALRAPDPGLVAHALHHAPLPVALEYLRSFPGPAGPGAPAALIKRCGRRGGPVAFLVAGEAFREALEADAAEADAEAGAPDAAAAAYLAACGRHDRPAEAEAALALVRERAARRGRPPAAKACNAALHALRGDAGRAEATFRALVERDGFAPDTVTYNTLLGAHAASGEARRADALYDEMRRAGVPPDFRTFLALGGAHAGEGNYGAVMVVAEGMRGAGTWDAATFWREVLRVFAARRDLDNVFRVWYRLLRAQAGAGGAGGLPPELVNAMLDACVACGQGSKALEIFRDSQRQGAPLDEASFKAGIRACKCIKVQGRPSAEDVELAEGLFGELGGVIAGRPRLGTWTALLEVYAEAGLALKAEVLVALIRAEGHRPNAQVHGELVKAYLAAGRAADAVRAFTAAAEGGKRVQPSVETCRAALRGLLRLGALDAARQVVAHMRRAGFAVPERDLEALNSARADRVLETGAVDPLDGAAGAYESRCRTVAGVCTVLEVEPMSVPEVRILVLKELGQLRCHEGPPLPLLLAFPPSGAGAGGEGPGERRAAALKLLEEQLNLEVQTSQHALFSLAEAAGLGLPREAAYLALTRETVDGWLGKGRCLGPAEGGAAGGGGGEGGGASEGPGREGGGGAAGEAADYAALTVVRLKGLLRERGLRVSGKKADLVARLEADAGSS